MPANASDLLERVASELGLSMEGLRQILKVTAQRMAEDGDKECPPVSVEALDKDGDEREDREVADRSSGSLNDVDVGDLRDRFEGATVHERLLDSISSASENASPPDTAGNSILARGSRMDGRSDEQDVYREAVTALLGVEACDAESRKFEDELCVLKEHGVTTDLVSKMAHKELAVSLAAHMVEYERVWLSQFVSLRAGLMELFFEETVSESLLVGDHAIPPGEFLELVVNALNVSAACRPTVGQKAALRRFIS
jgi:hypothetical protein